MSSTKSGASLPSHENPDVAKDDKGAKDKSLTTTKPGNNGKKEIQVAQKSSLSSQVQDTKATKNTSSTSSMNTTTSSNSSKPSPTGGATATTTATTSKTTPSATSVIAKIPDEKKNTSMPTATRTATGSAPRASNAPPIVASKHTSDPKLDSSATHAKRERAESFVSKSTTATAPKQSQQPSHSKPHTQQQQQQPQQQHRYFVPSRQNQEEAVFKMVQNIFKLLETRGPLTMAQLEYNLPILIFGSSPSMSTNAQTNNVSASKSSPAVSRDSSTGDSGIDASNVTKKQNADEKTANNRTSLCEEKLIPGNMVPDIVELLVTLGLIQQQKDVDDAGSSGATTTLSVSSPSHTSQKQGPMSAKNQLRNQPRFAVHFGKPKQFLVTPTNILSEIAKAQSEIQFSRQRQELLKEALSMADQQAAVRVKHIVLQHPQVVDDPVYVTALRNLQVDGMLMAGTSGAATAGNSNASSSSTRDGSGKSKSGVSGSGKKVGSNKRRQSSSTPAKRKRQRSRKDAPVRSGDADSASGKTITSPSGTHDVGSNQTSGGSLPLERSKQISSTRTATVSNIPTQAATAVPPTSANDLKST